jgi:hypothetical protein
MFDKRTLLTSSICARQLQKKREKEKTLEIYCNGRPYSWPPQLLHDTVNMLENSRCIPSSRKKKIQPILINRNFGRKSLGVRGTVSFFISYKLQSCKIY